MAAATPFLLATSPLFGKIASPIMQFNNERNQSRMLYNQANILNAEGKNAELNAQAEQEQLQKQQRLNLGALSTNIANSGFIPDLTKNNLALDYKAGQIADLYKVKRQGALNAARYYNQALNSQFLSKKQKGQSLYNLGSNVGQIFLGNSSNFSTFLDS